jgi:hypothetical protein
VGASANQDGDRGGLEWITDGRHASFVVASEMFAAYCEALDTGTSGDLRRLFHDEVELQLPAVTYSGVEAVAGSYDGFFAVGDRTTRHHVGNVRVLEHDDASVVAEAYLLAVTVRNGGLSLASGSYRDEFILVDDRWLIARKRIKLDIPFTPLATPGDDREHHDPQR